MKTMAIIAAGEGSRLKQEGIATPKALVPVAGMPMIERLMRIGLRHGIGRILVIVNETSTELHQYLRQQQADLPIELVIRSTPSSMHSLFALAPRLTTMPFLLCTVDSVFHESEFAAYLDAASASSADGVLAVTHFIDDEKPLCVVTDTDGRVLKFSDTIEGCDMATGGLYWLTPRTFDVIPLALERRTTRLRNFLRLLLEQSYDLRIFRFSKMIDVDHASDVEAADQFIAQEERSGSIEAERR